MERLVTAVTLGTAIGCVAFGAASITFGILVFRDWEKAASQVGDLFDVYGD